MKLRTYQLKDLSYSGLSMSYILLIIIVFIIMIVLSAVAIIGGNKLLLLLYLPLGGLSIYGVIKVGVNYGNYGLEILLAKSLMPRYIKNDLPLLKDQLLVDEQTPLRPTMIHFNKRLQTVKKNQTSS